MVLAETDGPAWVELAIGLFGGAGGLVWWAKTLWAALREEQKARIEAVERHAAKMEKMLRAVLSVIELPENGETNGDA